MPVYTHPSSLKTGVLNLANHLPWYANKPDLGPKGYIAYGRCERGLWVAGAGLLRPALGQGWASRATWPEAGAKGRWAARLGMLGPVFGRGLGPKKEC
jgi:hypothetical protein